MRTGRARRKRLHLHTERMAQPATRNLGRLSEIAQVAVRHGFGYWFERHRLSDISRAAARAGADDGQPSQRGQHLREMLDELGPTFVKFGQLLSTRPDVVPPDIIAELRGLQDDVRPFPFAEVEKVVERELGLTVEQLFSSSRPPGRGRLHRPGPPGDAAERREVAVRCSARRAATDRGRPRAPLPGRADRQGTRARAGLHRCARARGRVRALIRQELDYRLEARNAQTFHRNLPATRTCASRACTGATREPGPYARVDRRHPGRGRGRELVDRRERRRSPTSWPRRG